MRNIYGNSRHSRRSHVGGCLLMSIILAIVALFAAYRASKVRRPQPRQAGDAPDDQAGLEPIVPVSPAEVVGYIQRRPVGQRGATRHMQDVAWCMEHASRGRKVQAKYRMQPIRAWDESRLYGLGCSGPECSVEWGL